MAKYIFFFHVKKKKEEKKTSTARRKMNEEWISVAGYEGEYLVSNFGRVESRKRGEKRVILRGRECDKKGHSQVKLYSKKNGRSKFYLVHRLVAAAFLPNEKNFPEVDHINGDTRDNRVENLRWVTRSANQRNRKVCAERCLPLGIDKKRDSFRSRVCVDGKSQEKTFSIQKYGREKALEIAISARKKMEDEAGGFLASFYRQKDNLPETVTVHNHFFLHSSHE